ncbi:hypothetical protein S1OALGB6SA_1976 [Olavius algarvensis spirochete endosymbiont]|nr:hypothetical protein S1OALGB6SA_1976 [Olavius algarvensis spirochete endosymbiont]
MCFCFQHWGYFFGIEEVRIRLGLPRAIILYSYPQKGLVHSAVKLSNAV